MAKVTMNGFTLKLSKSEADHLAALLINRTDWESDPTEFEDIYYALDAAGADMSQVELDTWHADDDEEDPECTCKDKPF